jgi:biotin carboxylase
MTRTICILGGHDEAAMVVDEAHALGLDTVVACPDSDEPAARRATHHVPCNAYDWRDAVIKVVDWHRTSGVRVDGVLCGCIDSPLAASHLASWLEVPGLPLHVAGKFSDKLAQARAWPSAFPLTRAADVAGPPLFGPMVVKPCDSRGARGVSILTGPDGYWSALQRASEASPTGCVCVQSYVRGPQVSTEGVMLGDEYVHVATADRYYPDGSTLERGGNLPSTLPEETQAAIVSLVGGTAKALGARDCIIKGDVIVDEVTGRVFLCEIAARLSGGYFSTWQIPHHTGVNLVRAAILLALGERPEIERHEGPAVAKRIVFAPRGGTIRRIMYPDELRRAADWCAMVYHHRGPGQSVAPTTPIMSVIADGATAAEAVRLADDLAAGVVVEAR